MFSIYFSSFFSRAVKFCLGFLDDIVYFMLCLHIALFLAVSEPGRPVSEQVKEIGRMHTDCELLQPFPAFIGGLLVLPLFFFVVYEFNLNICTIK